MTGTVRVRERARVNGRVVYREAEVAAGVAVYVPDFSVTARRGDDEPPVLAFRSYGPWPELLPVRVGDLVEIFNADEGFHEPFSRSPARPMDLGWLRPGQSAHVRFEQPGLVQLFCNQHADEVAYLLVLPSPAAVVTRDDGAFVLSSLPAGRHRVVAWAPRARPVVRTVEVPAGGDVAIDLTVDLTLPVPSHTNKHGLPYRQGEISRGR